ncbi:MAG: redoxin domain-containing protein [Chloroherpetonaceae bacterium]|nr:redoxin domain-containing protein [Chthonomonadaceae bacterium]MDW8207259.1 redoxin domain-containing protein [Chloroherpetonaceae bacterium]
MPMRIGTPLPELDGATEWLNGEVKREELIGSPVLVHFWAVSCPICHDNMPAVAAWRDRYGPMGLRVVAVHSPRQEDDLDVAKVRADAQQMGMTEPCAIDNRHAILDRFQNELWPAYFLFDAEGNMKSRAGGYAGLKIIEGPLTRMMEPSSS